MTATRAGVAALVAALVVATVVGVPVALADDHTGNATAPGNGTDSAAGNESTPSDEELELVLEQSEYADIKSIEWYDDHAVITITTTQPVTVSYPTSTIEDLEEEEAREVMTTSKRIPRGETEIQVSLVTGEAYISIDGASVVLRGEQETDVSVLSVIGPTPALVLGAITGVAAAGWVAYRQRKDELEEPVKARDVWKRK